MENNNTQKNNKLSIVLILNIIALTMGMAFTALGAFFLKNDLTIQLIFVIAGLVFIAASIICSILLYVNYKRIYESADAVSSSIISQLDSFDAGKIKLANKTYLNGPLNLLQTRINTMIINHKNDQSSDKVEEVTYDESLTETLLQKKEFLHAAKDRIESSSSCRAAMIVFKIGGGNVIPYNACKSLIRQINKYFPKSYLYQEYADFVYACVPSIGSLAAFERQCNLLVSSFHYLEVKKETDSSTVFHCQIGAAIYPFVQADVLMKQAAKALDNGQPVNINIGNGQVYVPPAVFGEKQKRIVLLSSNETFRRRLYACSTPSQIQKVIDDILSFYAVILGFDRSGVLLFDSLSKEFHIYTEKSSNANLSNISVLTNGGRIAASDFIETITKVCSEGVSFIEDASLLPHNIQTAFASIEAKSLLVVPVQFRGEFFGLAYFVSKERMNINLFQREKADAFSSLISSAIIDIVESGSNERCRSLLENVIKRGNKNMYTIDKNTFEVVDIDSTLSKKVPEMQVGAICYKALRGADSPCEDCPFVKNATTKVIVPALGATELLASVISSRADSGRFVTVLLEKESMSLNSNNHLIDKALLIRNAKAFNQDLARDLHSRGNGFVFSMRITNAETGPSQNKNENIDATMRVVAGVVEDCGYSDVAYRTAPDTISFVLKNTTKALVTVFAEEIAEMLETPLVVGGVNFTPKTAYSLIAYPTDANTEFEIASLVKTELVRSQEIGEGYMTEIGKSLSRKAKRSSYIYQVMKNAVEKRNVQLSLAPIVASATGEIFAADASVSLYGFNRERIRMHEFVPIAEAHDLMGKLEQGSLERFNQFIKTYSDSQLKVAGVRHFVWNTSVATLLDAETMPKLAALMKENRLAKGSFIVGLNIKEVKANSEKVAAAIKELAAMGIEAETSSFDVNTDSDVSCAEMGFKYIRVASFAINDAISSESGSNLFIRSVGNFSSHGISAIVNGVNTQEQVNFCADLSLPYYLDRATLAHMSESEFISYINYR